MQAYTVDQACKILACGRSKFYELLNAQRLSAIKIGAKTVVTSDEIRRFLAEAPKYGEASG